MRFFRRSVHGLFLAALSAGLLALAAGTILGALRQTAGDGKGGPQASEQVVSVRVVAIAAQVLTPEITAYGDIRARRSLQIRAPRSGRIVWVSPLLVEGGAVASGASLVRLDTSESGAALALALADAETLSAQREQFAAARDLAQDALRAAEAQVALRVTATERQRDLLSRGAGSASAIESAELAESSARQGVLSARQALLSAAAQLVDADAALRRQSITLNEARRTVADAEITAAFAGVLTSVAVLEGGLVGANEPLAVLVDPLQLDLWIRLSTGQYARLLDASGQLRASTVAATLGSGDAAVRATGKMDRAAATVEAGQAGRLVTATLDPGSGLRPGDFVAVTVDETPLAGAALIPGRAVGADGSVLVLTADDRLESVAVTVLRRQGNDVIVDAKPIAGREIVTDRTPQVGAGMKVRPLRAVPDGSNVALNAADRARLIALVEADATLSDADRGALLTQLSGPEVPAGLVERITARAGG